MKFPLILGLLLTSSLHAVTWGLQVNLNGKTGAIKQINDSKTTFEAGPYVCEVTPVTLNNDTEYRSLVCAVGTSTVSTGGFCTRRVAKIASVQYAIMNLNGPKNAASVVLSCKFE